MSPRSLRIRRLCRDTGLLAVALDHSTTDGSIVRSHSLDALIGDLAGNGADAVILHQGALRHVDPRWFVSMSLVVHLSASTVVAPDPDDKVLVGSVESAIRLGADAVSVQLNLGSATEPGQLRALAKVARACDRWQIPLVAMTYPRGPKVANPRDPELVAHAVAVAVDLGADVVKTVCPSPVEELDSITRRCPVPLLVAGGPVRATANEVLADVENAMRFGAAGVAIGRNIFEAAQPGAMTRKIADVVHGRTCGR
jgi:2-amino-4,5-dihydroxy-6-oxo-7-(phosphonooxy)heptanoate synthase